LETLELTYNKARTRVENNKALDRISIVVKSL